MPPEELPLPQVPGYEVDAVLGHGGMGVVFRTRHLRLDRLVALKMTRAGSYATPHELERFRREAEAVAAFHHANIVQIYDVGDWAGRKPPRCWRLSPRPSTRPIREELSTSC